MDLKTLIETPPWDWPSDAGKMFQKILNDSRAKQSDRLLAAELAGDSTVINDDLADALMVIVRDAEEPEKLRARAAISLGAVLELADMDGFEDPDDITISEHTFHNIQDTFQRLYLDNSDPKEVRRGVLEASVRAPPGLAPERHHGSLLQRGQRLDADGSVFNALGSRFW